MIEDTNPAIAINEVISIARAAGDAIVDIYDTADFSIEIKDDDSPLTTADKRAHDIIVNGLKKLTPDIPIISEEGHLSALQERQAYENYWLIDPLDGTREFIKRNGEFTVNIALVRNHSPILGVVYVPVKAQFYYGEVGKGAYRQQGDSSPTRIAVSQPPGDNDSWAIVGSRSHQSEAFQTFIEQFPKRQLVSMGSSLKLCLVAEGKAHLYPRLGLTSEWDTAAAHAVVIAAGGEVFNYETQQPIKYNTKESLLNPHFIVCSPVVHHKLFHSEPESNIVWQDLSVNKKRRAERFKQKPSIIWFTGLSGSGKSTTACALEEKLFAMGYSAYLLDGDNIRHGLCSDLSFNDQDRVENVRRIGEVARLFVDAGFIVITAFISPFIKGREMVREIVEPGEFIEVYMNTPLAECEKRDSKGLYKKARVGEIKNFTGIDSPYEPPDNPEYEIATINSSVNEIVDGFIAELKSLRILN